MSYNYKFVHKDGVGGPARLLLWYSHPDPTRQFMVEVDALDVDAVLSQQSEQVQKLRVFNHHLTCHWAPIRHCLIPRRSRLLSIHVGPSSPLQASVGASSNSPFMLLSSGPEACKPLQNPHTRQGQKV